MKNKKSQAKTQGFNYWHYVKMFKWGFLFVLISLLLDASLSVASTILFATFIEKITLPNFMEAFKLLIITSVLGIALRLLNIARGIVWEITDIRISKKCSIDLLEHCFNLSSASYSYNNTASFMQRVSTDPNRIFNNLRQIMSATSSIITEAAIVVYITTLNLWLGLIVVATISIVFISERFRKNLWIKRNKTVRRLGENIDSLLNETIRSERDIKSLNLEQPLKERAFQQYDKYEKHYLQQEITDWAWWGSNNTFMFVTTVLMLVLGLRFMDRGMITLATFMILYSNRNSMANFVYFVNNIFKLTAEIKISNDRINELFDNETYTIEHFGKKNLTKVVGKITFKDVCFSYDEYRQKSEEEIAKEKAQNKKNKIKAKVKAREYVGKKPVLNNLNFEIKPNTTVAFVGKSGSGKSTILNLISKMYEVNKGKILIDETDIKQLNKACLRSTISLVNQFPYIFDMSIKENLLLAKPNATDKELSTALKESALDEFINTLPEGLNTIVGESGIKLSGGQKQRLAIARAMLKKSPIIIFDESTSSLDNIAQNQVKQSIDHIKGKSTIVIVAHRLSTIKNVDKIFFLEHGKIVDEGTFSKLFKNNENFKEIFLAENI